MKTSQGKLAVFAFLILIAALLLLPMKTGQEDSLILKPANVRMSPGGTYKLTCMLSTENEGQAITYSCSDPSVVQISGDGTIKALSSGTAQITVKATGGASAQCDVEVTGVPLSELTLNVSELHIAKGQHSGLTMTYNADASDTRLMWVSEDPSIATVDNTGRVEGISGGHTVVSIVAPNGKSASCDVWVDVPSTAMNITPYDMIVGVGAQITLSTSYYPEDSNDRVRSWVISNPNVLSIDENGVMTAKAEGTVHVNALSEYGLSAGMDVMVEGAPKDLEMNPSRATIIRGDTLDMQLLFMDQNGVVDKTNHPVDWTSSDTSVATVDQNGRVTAVRSGVTRITASSDGRTVSGYITVRIYVQDIALEQSEVYLLKEQTEKPIQLKLRTTPKDADNSAITFTSNNTQVATVSDEGLVTMTGGYGTAVITASAEGGATAEFTVNVVTQLPEATPEPTEEPEKTTIEQPQIEDADISAVDGETADTAGIMDEMNEPAVSWDDVEAGEADIGGTEPSGTGEYMLDEYGEIMLDEYGEPIYA